MEPLDRVTFPTASVPDVVKFSFPKLIDPPESVIEPLARVRLPIVDPVALLIVPVDVKFSLPKLIAPDSNLLWNHLIVLRFQRPMYLLLSRFSLPKLIAPDESVIDPSASVRLPSVDPVSAEIVPVVVKFSLPKLIAPLESIMEPLESVTLPTTSVPDVA